MKAISLLPLMVINNTAFTDTIKVLPKLQIPIGLSSIKWNDIFVFNVKENVENQ